MKSRRLVECDMKSCVPICIVKAIRKSCVPICIVKAIRKKLCTYLYSEGHNPML